MDKSSALIGTILLVLCAIPFIFIFINRRKKEKELLSGILSIAGTKKFELGEHEFCREFVIGKDKKGEYLFFSKRAAEGTKVSLLSFNDIQSCRMEKITRSADEQSGGQTIVEKLELHIQQKQAKEVWPLYNAAEYLQIGSELLIAQKWSASINDQAKQQNPKLERSRA